MEKSVVIPPVSGAMRTYLAEIGRKGGFAGKKGRQKEAAKIRWSAHNARKKSSQVPVLVPGPH